MGFGKTERRRGMCLRLSRKSNEVLCVEVFEPWGSGRAFGVL